MHTVGLVFIDTRFDDIDSRVGEQSNYDYYSIGGQFHGYIYTKDGNEVDEADFDEVDWEKMFTPARREFEFEGETVLGPEVTHHSGIVTDLDGNRSENMEDTHWFGSPEAAQAKKEWHEKVEGYVKHIAEMSDEDRKFIRVYVVDYHI